MRPAVFLDRDGTLNVCRVQNGRPYPPAAITEFTLLPGVATACRRLHAAGYVLVVATNQPDVGRGSQTQSNVEGMHARLQELIPEIAHIEVCYDSGRGEPSPRRKPEPGMLLEAAAALNLNLANSWMIGDRWRDIDAGHAAGCRTILLDYGYEEALRQKPDFVAPNLTEAARIILARPNRIS
ncbi:MAG: HAD-IIIA family hydrolase [Cephaloticoccus sp.]|nr:HAD-IIIA family hydrolase [Cephaloticoccus sp.]MCF7760829.1 HAD-IIIA family hydrolase [Cephaloticoccus sp.]